MEQLSPLFFTRNRNRRDRIGVDSNRAGSKTLRRTSPSVLLPRTCSELVEGLASKERTRTWGIRHQADPEHVFTEAVFTAAIVQAMRQVSRAEVPDMPDRIVAATAVYFDVVVISRDRRIRAASLKTVW